MTFILTIRVEKQNSIDYINFPYKLIYGKKFDNSQNGK